MNSLAFHVRAGQRREKTWEHARYCWKKVMSPTAGDEPSNTDAWEKRNEDMSRKRALIN